LRIQIALWLIPFLRALLAAKETMMASEPLTPDLPPQGPVDDPIPTPMDPIPPTPSDPVVGDSSGTAETGNVANIGNYPSIASIPLVEGP
jgi:hypothetical protein